MQKPEFVYVTYIRTTAEKLWEALVKPEATRQYWGGMSNVSDWKNGSRWEHRSPDDKDPWVLGEVLEINPPKRLVISWIDPENTSDKSCVTMEIEPVEDMVRLKVIHGDFSEGSSMQEKVSQGWPKVLSSMKSYLETGKGINIFAGGSCQGKAK